MKRTHFKGQLPAGEMLNFVKHRVTSSVDATVLMDRVKFTPGRQRGEHLSSVKIDALRVLILLRTAAGNPEGHRAVSPRILEDRHEPQYLTGSDRRLRVVRS